MTNSRTVTVEVASFSELKVTLGVKMPLKVRQLEDNERIITKYEVIDILDKITTQKMIKQQKPYLAECTPKDEFTKCRRCLQLKLSFLLKRLVSVVENPELQLTRLPPPG